MYRIHIIQVKIFHQMLFALKMTFLLFHEYLCVNGDIIELVHFFVVGANK